MAPVRLYHSTAITLGWNDPSVVLYCLVSSAALVNGDINFGNKCEIK